MICRGCHLEPKMPDAFLIRPPPGLDGTRPPVIFAVTHTVMVVGFFGFVAASMTSHEGARGSRTLIPRGSRLAASQRPPGRFAPYPSAEDPGSGPLTGQ